MKRFSFRLEPYLKLCRYREEQEKQALMELLAQRRRLEEQLTALRAEIDRLFTDMSGKRELPAYEAGWYRARISRLELGVQETLGRLDRLEEAVAQQRRRLIEARKEKKVAERLREKQWISYQSERDVAEQREMDDLFSQKYAQELSRRRRDG
ncbi:MAG TPA: flagellar export protein FliJ [Acidobacteriota bacterium]|nr:flagellar export protein FliJ [Acidobacteriota bacterium]HRR56974.1 flagellar export protein FliJ [Acidobacteriota bacterium]HRV08077.1 flagellar export protein FliJ [Acidobacteriota bacterium]